MASVKTFTSNVVSIHKLWKASRFDKAFAKVDEMLKEFPGNSQLLVMWACLLQLLDESEYGLDDAKDALQRAIDLDEESPAARIELGHFLNAVEDNPKAALKALSQAAADAKKLLVEALIGQAKSFLELNRRSAALRCLLEALQLTKLNRPPANGKAGKASASTANAVEIEALLSEALGRSESPRETVGRGN